MSARHGPPQRHGLPTLTEVIELAPLGDAGAALPSRAGNAARSESLAPRGMPALDAEQMIDRLLGDLQRDASLTLELRLREALAPVLARLADDLVRELRDKLQVTLREVVAQAASQELARRRAG
ncbi:MAG TPA: hypothetical protein PKC97_15470 [Burkholderiaceae bacterium]|jgi:hypothetical protein|nr:hypothetical protein [Burkholderiaceae bacterium]